MNDDREAGREGRRTAPEMSLSRSSRPKLAPCTVAEDDTTASIANSGASRDVVIARVRVVENIGVPRRFSWLVFGRGAGPNKPGGAIGLADLPVVSPASLSLQHGARHGAERCCGRGGGGVPGASRRRTRARVRSNVAGIGRGTPGVPPPSSRGCDFGEARGSRGVNVARAGAGDEGSSGTDPGGSGYVLPPPSSTRGGPPLGGLPNPRPISSLTRFPTHLVSPSHSGGRDAFPQRDDGGGRSGILRWIARQLTNQAKAIPLLRWPTYGIFNHRTWIALAVDSVIVTVALVALTAIMGGADIMAARVYKLVTGMRT